MQASSCTSNITRVGLGPTRSKTELISNEEEVCLREWYMINTTVLCLIAMKSNYFQDLFVIVQCDAYAEHSDYGQAEVKEGSASIGKVELYAFLFLQYRN